MTTSYKDKDEFINKYIECLEMNKKVSLLTDSPKGVYFFLEGVKIELNVH